MVNINDLTLGQLTEISNRFGGGNKSTGDIGLFEIGKNYFIRTVTHHYTGHLVPYPTEAIVLINREAIVDAIEWTNGLPGLQK